MSSTNRYTVRYFREEDGSAWNAEVVGEPKGCRTYGRSLQQTRNRIREALWACLDDRKAAYSAELVEDIQLPKAATSKVKAARKAREAAEQAQQRAMDATEAAARALTEEGFSTRDAADVLGISHGRVAQLVDDRDPKPVARAKGQARAKRGRKAA